MCVIFWSVDDPQYDLVIASNRDEFLARPTLAAAWHDFSAPPSSSSSSSPAATSASGGEDAATPGCRVLSARDSTGGGTWLGITRNGAFATLTNFTEQSAPLPPGLPQFESRGGLVRDWLLSQSAVGPPKSGKARRSAQEVKDDIEGYLNQHVGERLDRYPGFNLLVGALSSEGTVVGYITNRQSDGGVVTDRKADIFLPKSYTSVASGATASTSVKGMSNSILSEPWSKVSIGSTTFQSALQHASSSSPQSSSHTPGQPPTKEEQEDGALVESLFDLLWTSSNPKPTARSELRNSVLISPLELPAPADTNQKGSGAIKDWYATRTSTVILVRRDGSAKFVERDTFKVVDVDDSNGRGGGKEKKAVLINGPEASGALHGRSGGQRMFDWHLE